MGKKKKSEKKASKKAEKVAKTLEANTADVAHKIWLAGVGAYGKAYDSALANASSFNKQSSEFFEDLVKRGEEIESDVRDRLASNEAVSKASKSMAKYAEAARDLQSQAREQFEARMERMRDLLGVKGLGQKGDKLSAKLDKLEDEVAETVAKADAKAKDSNADLKARISRLTAEIEAVATEASTGYVKTTKKAATRTTKAMKEAMGQADAPKKKKKKAAKKAPEVKTTKPAKASNVAKPDDLTLITGLGPALQTKLNAAGITTYAQIAALKKAEADALDEAIGARGRIARNEWVKQAKVLMN